MPARPVVVYDANVLYPAQLRDFLMRLAVNDLVRAHWTDKIHGEWMRNVHADYPDVTWKNLERTRRLMDKALPDARVTGCEHHIPNLDLPDPDDRHVLAAAIQIGAECIVAFNTGDFPTASLEQYGIDAVDPDSFVVSLFETSPSQVVSIAAQHRGSLRHPPKSIGAYLALLENSGLSELCAAFVPMPVGYKQTGRVFLL